jgi:hypothetical protein
VQVLCIKAESQLLQLTLGGEQQFLGKGYLPYARARTHAHSHTRMRTGDRYALVIITALTGFLQIRCVPLYSRGTRGYSSKGYSSTGYGGGGGGGANGCACDHGSAGSRSVRAAWTGKGRTDRIGIAQVSAIGNGDLRQLRGKYSQRVRA